MFDIEKHISPLVQSMFPAFYQEDGGNFILFIQSYYEWLEENYQLLILTDVVDIAAGQQVRQGSTTGTVISVDSRDNSVLVKVNGFDTFRCFDMNTELEDLITPSGQRTFILHGGRGKRVSPIYWARHLTQLRDVDQTIDSFIINFKEKYLKNIEFDTSTNKKLLIKNSLDLYRSKGTERSIDLFFRLIYGEQAKVYYPGEDILKLSNAEWVKPLYLEITSSDRTVDLVGKQIRGVSSGATAFVEKYIKRRVKDSFVFILYVSNANGTFEPDEQIFYDRIFSDLPKIKGSLTEVTIVTGSREFNVGDIVSFSSNYGDFGFARVDSIDSKTGQVDFILEDGGYGYTTSANPTLTSDDLKKRTQSLVSDKVLVLSNVRSSNTIDSILVNSGGTGYSNNDVLTIVSPFANCVARPVTNSTGGILSVTINRPGSGFYSNNPGPVIIANSTGGSSTGTGASLTAVSKAQNSYFKYFDSVTQPIRTVTYNAASNNQAITQGSAVSLGNSTATIATGVVVSNDPGSIADANGVLRVSISNNASTVGSTRLFLTNNTSVNATISSITSNNVTARLMGIPSTGVLTVTGASQAFEINDIVYQQDSTRGVFVEASVRSFFVQGTNVVIEISNLRGAFDTNLPILVRNKATTASFVTITLNIGVDSLSSSFLGDGSGQIFTTNTGVTGNIQTISQGSGAGFRVETISDPEIIYLNTDLLGGNNVSNTPYMTLPINALAYGFPKNPAGNLSAVMFSCLNFDSFTVGTIASLSAINPGTEYNIDPYVLAYQPYLSAFNYFDYNIEIENVVGTFAPGERLLQTNTLLTNHTLVLSNTTGIELGMKVKQGTSANGIVIEITTATNNITLQDVQGSFAANSTPLTSFSNTTLSHTIINASTSSVISTAAGIVKSANNTILRVKRTQFFNRWRPTLQIRGSISGATANIVSVEQDSSLLPLGLNADIEANVVTADGTVTNLEIIDSGFGYRDNDEIAFVSEDRQRAGSAVVNLTGLGRGAGYYKTSKGFLSSSSKIQDGDYYQEYSYEVISRIPLDKYSEMFKKVMHVAGTRFFGGVLLESINQGTNITITSDIDVDQQ